MNWIVTLAWFWVAFTGVPRAVMAQIPQKAETYLTALKQDPQFAHAHIGWCVARVATGQKVSAFNANDMFIPASTLKTITAAYALEKLGDTFHFRTTLNYWLSKNRLHIEVISDFDPTLGSHRFPSTRPDTLWHKLWMAINSVSSNCIIQWPAIFFDRGFGPRYTLNGAWLWQDLANYYAAPAQFFNWRENFYRLYFNTGNKEGDGTQLSGNECKDTVSFINNVTTTLLNKEDNAYIYYDVEKNSVRHLEGTLPNGKKDFIVKGTDVNVHNTFSAEGFQYFTKYFSGHGHEVIWKEFKLTQDTFLQNTLLELHSPPLSDILHTMLKHSINLYAEALVKRAAENNGKDPASCLRLYGTHILNDSSSLTLYDACGLSPINRVTPVAMCKLLNFAEKQSGTYKFHTYLNPLETTTELAQKGTFYIKDGYMTGVRSIAGYYQNHFGVWYSFFISANDIQGDSRAAYYKIVALLERLFE